MLEVYLLVLAPFAVYRIALMLAQEEGPFALFEKFRNLYVKNDWLGRGLRCPACISFWAGLTMAILLYYLHSWYLFQVGVFWLGLSGVSVALYRRNL